MPDMVPVATMIKPPDPNQGLATLSSILGIRQAQQNLATGVYQQQSAQAAAAQDQQKNRELQAAQQLVINGARSGQYDDGQGNIDRVKLSNDILKVAPVYGSDLSTSLLSQANEVVRNKQAHQDLTLSQKKEMGNTFASWAADPKIDNTKIIDDIERLRQAHPNDPEFSRLLTSQIMHLPNGANSKQLQDIAGRWAAAATGEQQTSAGTMDTGANIQPGGVNRFTGAFTPAGASLEKKLPPQIITNPTTQGPAVVGGGAGTTPQPIGGATGPNTWQPYAGQQGDIKTYQGEVQGTRQAADSAPTARNINAQILRLADDAKTGPGTEVWQHAVGALAAPFGLSPTASYQELGKFLEKNAIQNMTSMGGPPSDARLSAAAAANGSTHFSPEALKAVTKFNDATNTALMEYRQGMDRAVGMGQNVDYTRLPAFKAAWAKNFDVDVFRVENAIRDGDKAELAKIKKEVGPQRLKELSQKSANLRLLEQGQIPNG